MLLGRAPILSAAAVSSSLLAGLAVAESSGVTTSDTDAEASIATMLETLSETTVATTPDTAAETPARPESAEVEILPPDEPWGGLTRGEWDARSWQWVLSLPEDINPWGDTTGERCGYGQSGPVFLLTPVEDEITCVVAEGTAIWVNVANTECATVEPPPFFGRTEEELRGAPPRRSMV
jgi:hypothetical protein